MIRESIIKLSKKQDLTYQEAEEVMDEIMSGKATPVQMSAYLTALALKGETIDEITASAAGMRAHCIKLLHDMDVLEIVGTGGDGSNSFNISTTASLVISAGGVSVAKHGNRAASSKSGAADVLEALGVKITIPSEKSQELLEKIGICFLFAQNYHIAMKYVAPIRKELGIRTVFNILGPLSNPAGANMELMGVYDEALVQPLAQVMANLGVTRGMVVFGQDSLDEISMSFSAILAVAGYMFRQMYTRSGLEILLDYNTYVWVAQLFILGLVVGYMRDQIRTMRMESQELEEHLSRQIADIKDINESNVRVKGVMEQQLIDHKDSIGKIYSITSKLDQYMPDEVIFYAVEMLTKLMQTKDAAIYNVVNKDYARIFSASSKKARSLGNSIRYKDMTEVYEALSEKRVYINKRMNDQYPQMACAIFEDDEIQMIVMLWGLSWEKMTLGQANFLTVVSYMIQNAVLRAQRYIQALEAQRYKKGSRILSPEAFEPLVQAYMDAEIRNLAECVLLKICISPDRQMEIDEKMISHLRDSDYLGMMTDGNLYVLLANTTRANAVFVQERFDRNGYNTEVVENIAVCHKE